MTTKELIIVGGANGAGKTTFAVEYAVSHRCLYLGLDAIAGDLAPGTPDLVLPDAARQLMQRLTTAFAEHESVVLESTLAGRTLRHTIRDARNAGSAVTIVYLFLDSADACVERVRQRVQKGGHPVLEADIRRRFLRSIRNFWYLYRPLADHWLLVYNSSSGPEDVAGGVGDDVTVWDADLYGAFTQMRLLEDRDG